MSAKLILKIALLCFGFLILINTLNLGYESGYRLIYGKASYSTKAIFRVPNSKVEIILERRAAHLFLGEYERTLVLRLNGKSILRTEAAFDTGGYSRMNVYRISPSEYFVSGAFSYDSFKLNVERREISSTESEEKPAQAKFVGAFDKDNNYYWRFIPASEREELKTKL